MHILNPYLMLPHWICWYRRGGSGDCIYLSHGGWPKPNRSPPPPFWYRSSPSFTSLLVCFHIKKISFFWIQEGEERRLSLFAPRWLAQTKQEHTPLPLIWYRRGESFLSSVFALITPLNSWYRRGRSGDWIYLSHGGWRYIYIYAFVYLCIYFYLYIHIYIHMSTSYLMLPHLIPCYRRGRSGDWIYLSHGGWPKPSRSIHPFPLFDIGGGVLPIIRVCSHYTPLNSWYRRGRSGDWIYLSHGGWRSWTSWEADLPRDFLGRHWAACMR